MPHHRHISDKSEKTFLEFVQQLADTFNGQLHFLDFTGEEVESFEVFANTFFPTPTKREALWHMAVAHVAHRLWQGGTFTAKEAVAWTHAVTYHNYDFGAIRGHIPEGMPAQLPVKEGSLPV